MDREATHELVDVVVRLPRSVFERSVQEACAPLDNEPCDRLAQAKALVTARRQRARIFHYVTFDDVCWDLFLELYIARSEGRAVQVSKLCVGSARSITTTLRHVHDLERQGLVVRTAHPTDRRSSLIVMSETLHRHMEEWLDLQARIARG